MGFVGNCSPELKRLGYCATTENTLVSSELQRAGWTRARWPWRPLDFPIFFFLVRLCFRLGGVLRAIPYRFFTIFVLSPYHRTLLFPRLSYSSNSLQFRDFRIGPFTVPTINCVREKKKEKKRKKKRLFDLDKS